MAKYKPLRIGDTVPQQQIASTEEIDGKIYCSTNNIVLGRLSAGDGPHEEIAIGDLPGGGGGSSITDISVSDMQTAITAGTLTEGQLYRIADAAATDFGFITNAVSEGAISQSGVAGFLNCDFQAVGDYSGVFSQTGVSPGVQSGVWFDTMESGLSAGDIVIWNLKHFQLTDIGVIDGTDPETNTAAYTELSRTAANVGYITEWDVCGFDIENDWLFYRQDKRGNKYTYTFATDDENEGLGYTAITEFQWGNDNHFDNIITNGYFSATNIAGRVFQNVFGFGSYFTDNVMATTARVSNNVMEVQAEIMDNILSSGSSIILNNIGVGGAISDNTLGSNSRINRNVVSIRGAITGNSLGSSAIIEFCNIGIQKEISYKTINANLSFSRKVMQVTSDQSETISTSVVGNIAQPGFSDIRGTFDITGLTTLDPGAAAQQYVGIFNVTSTNSTEDINQINNAPTGFPFEIRPSAGLVLTITGTALSTPIAAGQIALKTTDVDIDGSKGEYIVLQAHADGYLYEVNRVVGLL